MGSRDSWRELWAHTHWLLEAENSLLGRTESSFHHGVEMTSHCLATSELGDYKSLCASCLTLLQC